VKASRHVRDGEAVENAVCTAGQEREVSIIWDGSGEFFGK